MKVKIDSIVNNQVYFTVNGVHYMTNKNGYGLFKADDYYQQYKGTLQFSLQQKTRSGMRKAIIRQLSND